MWFLSCFQGNIQSRMHRRLISLPAALCLIALNKRGGHSRVSHRFTNKSRHSANEMTPAIHECLGKALRPSPHLVNEHLRPPGAHQQHGPSQGVPVAVELFGAHGAKEVVEDSAHVAVHTLQGHVQAEAGRLVHEGLQASNVWWTRRRKRWLV